MKKQELIASVGIIFIAVLLRLLPHPPNVAPIAAMALFGGAYFNKKYALLIPVIALFISDLFLGFHESMLMVYGSFLLTGCIGLWLAKHKKVGFILGASLVSSCVFYLLTNFNYWYATPLYPKTFAGMMQSYIAALPFLRNSIVGDLLYTGIFFGSMELVKTIRFSMFARKGHAQ